MKKIRFIIIIILSLSNSIAYSSTQDFNNWLKSFKIIALQNNITEKTFNLVMRNAKFNPKVIEYDRYQPEFYEDTKTYINKRTRKKKVKNGLFLYNSNSIMINNIESKFNVEKELLLSLMGIETNFGTYLGKMDIVSSLATLSFDKRRSQFFTNELITILQLIDKKKIDYKTLYGSWAGAFGNFQFMPTTIEKYAIDYNNDHSIDLKSIDDSFASAANYINKIGWKNSEPCFYPVILKKNIPKKYLNYSARKIKNKKKFKYYKKYIVDNDKFKLDDNLISAIITPDAEIVDNVDPLKPAYIVFNNYELILKWNRSLRFALAVCTLKEKFKNEL